MGNCVCVCVFACVFACVFVSILCGVGSSSSLLIIVVTNIHHNTIGQDIIKFLELFYNIYLWGLE